MKGLRSARQYGRALILLSCLTAGCSSPAIPGNIIPSEKSCEDERFGDLAAIDWSRAPEVDIDIHRGEFNPAVVSLSLGHPYRLVVTNQDKSSRVLNASDFFLASSVYTINRNDEITTGPCIATVSLDPGAVAEIKVVPGTVGRFNLDETYLPLRFWGTGLGAIVVD